MMSTIDKAIELIAYLCDLQQKTKHKMEDWQALQGLVWLKETLMKDDLEKMYTKIIILDDHSDYESNKIEIVRPLTFKLMNLETLYNHKR